MTITQTTAKSGILQRLVEGVGTFGIAKTVVSIVGIGALVTGGALMAPRFFGSDDDPATWKGSDNPWNQMMELDDNEPILDSGDVYDNVINRYGNVILPLLELSPLDAADKMTLVSKIYADQCRASDGEIYNPPNVEITTEVATNMKIVVANEPLTRLDHHDPERFDELEALPLNEGGIVLHDGKVEAGEVFSSEWNKVAYTITPDDGSIQTFFTLVVIDKKNKIVEAAKIRQYRRNCGAGIYRTNPSYPD